MLIESMWVHNVAVNFCRFAPLALLLCITMWQTIVTGIILQSVYILNASNFEL